MQFVAIKKLCVRVFLVLFAVISLCMALAYGYFVLNKDALTHRLAAQIKEMLGDSCSVASIDIFLAPKPHITLKNVRIVSPSYAVSLDKLVVSPSLPKLIFGTFDVTYLFLQNPHISVEQKKESSPASQNAFFQGFAENTAYQDFLPSSCVLVVENGGIRYGANEISGIDCYVHVTKELAVSGDIFVKTISFATANKEITIEDLFFLGDLRLLDFAKSRSKFDLRANISGVDGLRGIAVQTSVQKKSETWEAKTDIAGHVEKDSVLIPFYFRGSLLSDTFEFVRIDGASLGLGGRDRGTLSCDISVQKMQMEGTLSVAHVSLTEWLGFARALPAGLQISLDNITEGNLEFLLDTKKLVVRKVSAKCAGAFFSGRGGVADWKKPVVFLEMQSPAANLLKGIPEAGAKLPKEPKFPHGPLTPESSDPSEPASVGYDIRLGADVLAYGPLRIRNAKVVIHPGYAKALRESLIILDANASFYDGQVKGSCVLGGDKTVTYGIKLQFTDVNGELVGKAMPLIPVRKGKWNGSLSITSATSTLDGFLKQLRGSIKVDGRQCAMQFGSSSKAFSCNSCQMQLHPLRSGQFKSNILGLDGVWKGNFDWSDKKAQVVLNGKLGFGETSDKSGVEIVNVPATCTFLQQNKLSLNARCILTLLGSQAAVRCADAKVASEDASFAGTFTVHTQREITLLGKGSAEIANLSSLIGKFRADPVEVPEYAQKFSGLVSFACTEKKLNFYDLGLKTDLGSVSGKFEIELDKQILLPNLIFKRLNFDSLVRKDLSKGDSKKNLQLVFQKLNALNVRGSITAQDAIVKKLHILNLVVPFELKDGLLACRNVRGRLFQGLLQGSASVAFTKVFELQSTITLEQLNLEQLSESMLDTALLKGAARVSAQLRAAFDSFSDWPQCLYGSWNFRVTNGFYQEISKKKQVKKTPITYSLLQASGSLAAGTVKSSNIAFVGDAITVTGKGEYNLSKQTVDATLDVDMKGVPRFPVYIEGPLNKTKMSFGAGSFILNAVTGIFSGIFSIFK